MQIVLFLLMLVYRYRHGFSVAMIDRVNRDLVWQRSAFWFIIVIFESENPSEIESRFKHLSMSNSYNIVAANYFSIALKSQLTYTA